MLNDAPWLILVLLFGMALLVFFGLIGDAKNGRGS